MYSSRYINICILTTPLISQAQESDTLVCPTLAIGDTISKRSPLDLQPPDQSYHFPNPLSYPNLHKLPLCLVLLSQNPLHIMCNRGWPLLTGKPNYDLSLPCLSLSSPSAEPGEASIGFSMVRAHPELWVNLLAVHHQRSSPPRHRPTNLASIEVMWLAEHQPIGSMDVAAFSLCPGVPRGECGALVELREVRQLRLHCEIALSRSQVKKTHPVPPILQDEAIIGVN